MSTPPRSLETFPNPNPERDYVIRFDCPEFTCLCPKTGQPDFATIRVRVRARRAVRRAQVVEALPVVVPGRGRLPRGGHQPHPRRSGGCGRPRRLRVEGAFNVRGGITTTIVAEHTSSRPGRAARSRSPRLVSLLTICGASCRRPWRAWRLCLCRPCLWRPPLRPAESAAGAASPAEAAGGASLALWFWMMASVTRVSPSRSRAPGMRTAFSSRSICLSSLSTHAVQSLLPSRASANRMAWCTGKRSCAIVVIGFSAASSSGRPSLASPEKPMAKAAFSARVHGGSLSFLP